MYGILIATPFISGEPMNYNYLKLFLFVAAIMGYSFNANAQEIISCRTTTEVSDSGYFIEIFKLSSGHNYKFSEESYSGKKTLRERKVKFSATSSTEFCKLAVYADDMGSSNGPMFYIYKDSSESWKVLGAGSNQAPAMACNVSIEFENQNCGLASRFEPVGINPN